MIDTAPAARLPRWLAEEEPRLGGRSDSYRFAQVLTLVLLIVALDVKNFLIVGAGGPQGERYLFLIIPLAAVLWIRMGSPSTVIRNPAGTDLSLAILVLFALPGTLAARLSSGAASTILALVASGSLAFLYLLTVEEISEREAGRIARGLAVLGGLYTALAAIGYSGVAPWLVEARGFRNAKVFFLAIGIAGVVSLRWRFATLALILLAAVVFRGYPSATFALAGLVTVLVLFITRPGRSNARVYVVLLLFLGVAVAAMLNSDRTVGVTSNYFASVGKTNNNVVRFSLWRAGLDKFARSPLYGDAFYGPTAISVYVQHPPYPPYRWPGPLHNDFLLLASSGGIIAFGLFGAWATGTNVIAFRRFRSLAAAGKHQRAAVVRILLVGFDTWLCAALFNPLLQEIGTAASLMAIYALILMVGGPPRPLLPEDAAAEARRARGDAGPARWLPVAP